MRRRCFCAAGLLWRRHSVAGSASGEMRRALLVTLVAAVCVNLTDAACVDKWKAKKCAKKVGKGLCATAVCPSKKKKCKKTAKKCQKACGLCDDAVVTPTSLCSCSAFADGASAATATQGVCIKAGICRPAGAGACPSDMSYCAQQSSPPPPPPPPPPVPAPEGGATVPAIQFEVVLDGDAASFDVAVFRSASRAQVLPACLTSAVT